MKKLISYLVLLLFPALVCGQKKPAPIHYSDAFVHEAMELYDWNEIEQQFSERHGIKQFQTAEFFQFAFHAGDESMKEYLSKVYAGLITKKNAQAFWQKKHAHFDKLYTDVYLPYLNNRLSSLRKGPGNNSVFEGGANCNNLDFTDGVNGWTGMWNDESGVTGAGLYGNLTVSGLNMSGNTNQMGFVHELCNPGIDPNIGISTVPPGHNVSLRLGNDSAYKVVAGIADSYYPFNHQIISNTFQVTESNKAISYWYAFALSQYNPNNHAANIQPYFKIRMYDQSGNEIVCARYDIDALTAATIGGFNLISTFVDDPFAGSLPYDFYYRDWSQVMIPLSNYVGQNVTLTFETSDCAGGGHFAYAYVAVDCAPLPNITINPIPCSGGTGTLTGPAGAATYFWSGPGIVGSANSQTITYNSAGTYSVTMTTLGNSGFTCTFGTDTVVPPPPGGPQAAFNYTAYCAGVPAQFSDASNGNGSPVTSWQWDFGDGTTSALTNPTHTYVVGGPDTYPVSFTITTANGCTDTYTVNIDLNQGSAASFTSNTVCIGGSTLFTNTTPGTGNTYHWDFGDNAVSQNTDPAYVYASAGTYQASLTVTTPLGCTNTTTQNVIVNNQPTASFSNTIACAGSPVSFTNTSSVLSGTYDWNFGDPSTTNDVSGISNPSYQYNNAGTYTVSLNIDAGNNCIASTTQAITVKPIPSATVTPISPACPGELISSPLIQSNPATGVGYSWNNSNTQTGMPAAGNGIPSSFTALQNITGNNVTGIVTITPSLNGCAGPPVSYTINIKPSPVIIPPVIQLCPHESSPLIHFASNPADPSTTYAWNATGAAAIGLNTNQGTSTIPSFTTINNTPNVLSAIITAVATLNGCVGPASSFPVLVNPYPTAEFSAGTACSGNPTTFNSQSFVNNGSIAQANWDFNNDQQFSDANGAAITYTLSPAGYHTIALEVISDKGCKDTVSHTVYVNHTPLVNFSGDKLQGCPTLPVSFTSNSSIAPPAQIVSYNWNFGNSLSTTDSGIVSSYYINESYTNSAYYTVSLQAISDSGCAGIAIKQNYITVFPTPSADFVWDPSVPDMIDPTVNFFDQSHGANGTPALVWHLGDLSLPYQEDNYTTVKNPVHEYPYEAGTYDVTQWVKNEYGCKDSITKTIHIAGAFTFYIPNAFTPNRGTLNKGFKGTGIGINNDTYVMYIFNRWGELIFEAHDLEEEWDGTYKGNHVQNDVYAWKVSFDDIEGYSHQYAGTVTLIR